MKLPRIIRLPAAACILTAAFLCTQAALADETLLRGPRKNVTTTVQPREPATGIAGIQVEIASAPIRFYQRFLRHQWGWTCAYYPSCSDYALLAVRKHGALVGFLMTFDRLQHEADEGRVSPPIRIGGQIKVYDPLENNDYWWYTAPYSKPAPPAKIK